MTMNNFKIRHWVSAQKDHLYFELIESCIVQYGTQ